MSVTEAPAGGSTSAEVRPKGLKLPPPAPPKFSLTLKIFLAMALLILVAVGGAVAVSAYRARQVADAKIAEDLKKAGPGWESFQQNRYDELHRALAVIVNNAGTISMMSTLVPETGRPDPATVFDTLKREQASSVRADFLIATTPAGVALARTDRPLPYTADLSAVPTIAGALQGAQTEGIWLSGGKLYHVVAAPVLEGGARLTGVIAAAFQIDDDVARNLERLLNTQVVFLADAAKPSEPARVAVAASTMGPGTSAAMLAIERRPDLVQAVLRQGRTIGPLALDLSGETYLAYLLPIRSSTDQLVGAAVALRSRERELAAFRQIQAILVAVGLAALVIAFVLSFFLARRITGGVGRLVRATEQVRVGNLDAPDLPVESNDEIGILARSFRAMLEELREKAALEQYVASLTMSMAADAETVARTAVSPATRPGSEPVVGQLFASRYEIQGVLGRGGMGIVYRAHDRDLDDAVAIKTLRGEALSADPTLLDRFKQEIRLARRITHPNILRTHDLGESGGPALPVDGVRQGAHAQAAGRGGRHPAHPRGPADRQADLRGPGRRARGRRDPPRHQAAEHHHRVDRRPEDHGLRHRPPQGRARDDGRRAPSSGPPTTCRPSRRGARRSISAPTSTRPASCSTRSSPARCLSKAIRRSPWSSSTSRRIPLARRRAIRGSTRGSRRSS